MILEPELLQAIANAPIDKRAITNPQCLNEAYHYVRPSSFSRGMRLDLNGLAILLISSDLSEVLAMSDRIIVLHEGRITAEIARANASEETVMFAATGQGGASDTGPADG